MFQTPEPDHRDRLPIHHATTDRYPDDEQHRLIADSRTGARDHDTTS